MDTLNVRPARYDEPGVAAIIAAHFKLMRATSPEESCHVMPADALAAEGAELRAAELGGSVVGIGALKEIAPQHGEVKSMHTLAAARGHGAARAILKALMDHARAAGMTRLSLETGSTEEFIAARQLYASEGFEDCAPFGNYIEDPLSTFMTRSL